MVRSGVCVHFVKYRWAVWHINESLLFPLFAHWTTISSISRQFRSVLELSIAATMGLPLVVSDVRRIGAKLKSMDESLASASKLVVLEKGDRLEEGMLFVVIVVCVLLYQGSLLLVPGSEESLAIGVHNNIMGM